MSLKKMVVERKNVAQICKIFEEKKKNVEKGKKRRYERVCEKIRIPQWRPAATLAEYFWSGEW